MKLGWGMVSNKNAFWVKVLRDKYKCGDDLIPRVAVETPGSNVWSGIKKTWNSLLEGLVIDQARGSVQWKWERSGNFSVKSAYQVVSGNVKDQGRDWGALWKVRAPQRCKTLLWLLTRQSLLTNACRMRRGLTFDETCPLCGGGCEDTLHVFRDCTYSKALWRKVVGPSQWRTFGSMSLSNWVWWNIRGKAEARREWASHFTILCWWLWRRRNLFVFEHNFLPNDNILASSSAMVESMQQTIEHLAGMKIQGAILAPSRESWRPPEGEWVKVNVDGAFSRKTMTRACGGLIRNSSGSFVKGFIRPLEDGDELTAELWACIFGFKMAWALGFRKVWLETDSTECLDLILHELRPHHRDSGLVKEVKVLMGMEWETKATYVPRKCNRAADYLAKSGLDTGQGFHEVYKPPEDLVILLCQDCNGVTNPIGIS